MDYVSVEYAGNRRNISVERPPLHYFPPGVVAHTDCKHAIAKVPQPFVPYQNGIHGGPAVLEHEIEHVYRDMRSQPQDERAINRIVAARLRYADFPFSSY